MRISFVAALQVNTASEQRTRRKDIKTSKLEAAGYDGYACFLCNIPRDLVFQVVQGKHSRIAIIVIARDPGDLQKSFAPYCCVHNLENHTDRESTTIPNQRKQ